jgi:pyruvate-formate lyase
MYKFKRATDRIKLMHQLIRDRVIQTDAASPAQGRDRNSPTAVFISARCYDHSKSMDDLALNVRIHPSALSREDGVAKLRDMTKTYLNCSGMEVQYNVVSSSHH